MYILNLSITIAVSIISSTELQAAANLHRPLVLQ